MPQDQQDLAWSIDTTAQWNYFQRVYIHLFLNGWDEERENGLLHPDLCNILDQMEKWEDIEEINNNRDKFLSNVSHNVEADQVVLRRIVYRYGGSTA